MKYLFVTIIFFYKVCISPILTLLFGYGCRFSPTCSEYAIEALKKYGILRGVSLSLARITRCQPWSKTTYDPVP